MSFSDRVLGFGAFPNRDTDDYEIDQSLMFDGADGAYLHRTPGSAGNRRTFTWSAWIKRSHLGVQGILSADHDATNWMELQFSSADKLWLYFQNANDGSVLTAAQFRDTAAWYHIVVAVDTTQGTASNRVKIYVNGEQMTLTGTYPSEDLDTAWNNSEAQWIGESGNTQFFDGYMAEMYNIDGTALTPSSFGETDSTTGQWIPKEAAGLTYGTNGFYLKFVSGALGTDSAGSNNYTAVNLANSDVVSDTPTKNFPTWSPLDFRVDLANMALSQGNLKITSTTSNGKRFCTGIPDTGKWYYEITFTAYTQSGTSYFQVQALNGSYIWHDTSSTGDRQIVASTGTTDDIPQFATGDVLQIAIDMDNFKQWYGRNNTWITTSGTPDPAAGTGAADIFDAATIESFSSYTRRCPLLDFRGVASGAQNVFDINFGQRDFAYTPPTGFKSVNSQNWPTPTIKKPTNNFNTVLWAGSGSTDQDISGVGFQPDFTWVKMRTDEDGVHVLHDAVRGAGYSFTGTHTSSIDEADDSAYFGPFQSDGFRLADTTSGTNWNKSGDNYVAWNWLAGNTTLGTGDFTQGATASTCSRNVDAGFSIVTFTGTGSATTVGHGLSAAPSFMLFHIREAHNIPVYHHKFAASPETVFHYLGSASVNQDDATVWNDTAPTSSVFSVGTSDMVNKSTVNTMAYCWTEVEGYSKFGSYEGNNNADGPFVFCGFRPAYVLIKHIDNSGESYWLLDNKRDTHNPTGVVNWANLIAGEYDYGEMVDFTSNGFKIKSTNGGINGYTSTYVFVAFAEFPFKYSNAR